MKRRSLLPIGFIVLSILMLTASCSNSPEAQDDQMQADRVKLGFSAWPGWFPWQVSKDQKLFAANKASVDLQWFGGYTDSIDALSAGKLDANSQTLGDTVSAIAGGADLTIVMTNDRSDGNDKIIARNGITTIADLKGKTVAVEEGTVDHFLLLQGLKKAGLTSKDIILKPLETSQATYAFETGIVDAVAVFAPYTTRAMKVAGSKELFSSKDFPGSITDHLVFSNKFIKAHPDRVQAVVDSWFATLEYIKAHPAESDKVLALKAGVDESEYRKYATGTRILSLEENLAAFKPTNDLNSLPYAAATTSAFLTEAGLVKTQPDLRKLFDDRFVKAAAAKAKK